jgi:hypothetical protein
MLNYQHKCVHRLTIMRNRIRKNLLFAFIALLAFSVVCWSQTGTVNGTVTDDEGNLVENARVMLRSVEGGCGTCIFTTTDENGFYVFEDVEVGDYIARAMKHGVGRAVSDEFEVVEGQTVTVDLQLEGHGCGGGGGGGCG